MSHKHHIIPKHMGGSDDKSNLIELSVADHAEAHRKLYEEHGLWQDYVAWQGLAKLMPKEQLIKRLQSEGGKKCREMHVNPFAGSRIGNNFAISSNQQQSVALAKTEKARSKRKQTFGIIKHQQGEKNSQFGKCWVTHPELGNRKINKDELEKFLSLGYSKGRKMVVN
jgi:hypothetical protein